MRLASLLGPSKCIATLPQLVNKLELHTCSWLFPRGAIKWKHSWGVQGIPWLSLKPPAFVLVTHLFSLSNETCLRARAKTVSEAGSLAHRCFYVFHTSPFNFYSNLERRSFMTIPIILRKDTSQEFQWGLRVTWWWIFGLKLWGSRNMHRFWLCMLCMHALVAFWQFTLCLTA